MRKKKPVKFQPEYDDIITKIIHSGVTQAYDNGFNNGIWHCIQQLHNCCGKDAHYLHDAAILLKEFNKERLK